MMATAIRLRYLGISFKKTLVFILLGIVQGLISEKFQGTKRTKDKESSGQEDEESTVWSGRAADTSHVNDGLIVV